LPMIFCRCATMTATTMMAMVTSPMDGFLAAFLFVLGLVLMSDACFSQLTVTVTVKCLYVGLRLCTSIQYSLTSRGQPGSSQ
jgi:energy-converting hydrogenase Eha subunit B